MLKINSCILEETQVMTEMSLYKLSISNHRHIAGPNLTHQHTHLSLEMLMFHCNIDRCIKTVFKFYRKYFHKNFQNYQNLALSCNRLIMDKTKSVRFIQTTLYYN